MIRKYKLVLTCGFVQVKCDKWWLNFGYICPQARFWFISSAGFSSEDSPTVTAGTPATVV